MYFHFNVWNNHFSREGFSFRNRVEWDILGWLSHILCYLFLHEICSIQWPSLLLMQYSRTVVLNDHPILTLSTVYQNSGGLIYFNHFMLELTLLLCPWLNLLPKVWNSGLIYLQASSTFNLSVFLEFFHQCVCISFNWGGNVDKKNWNKISTL